MQIRVRAWHKAQKKMYYPEELGADQLTLMPDGRGFVNVSGSDTRLSEIDDNRTMVPLMFTGLRDKNGEEIYEGDVVAVFVVAIPEPYVGIVEYGQGKFSINCRRPKDEHHWYQPDLDGSNGYEIRGNIYENLGLLEGR